MALRASSSGGFVSNAMCWPPYASGTGDILPLSEEFFRAGMSVDVINNPTNDEKHLLVVGTYTEPHSAFLLSNLDRIVEDETACQWSKFDLRECGMKGPRVGHATTVIDSAMVTGITTSAAAGAAAQAAVSQQPAVFLHGGYHGNVRKHTKGRVDRSVFGDAYVLTVQSGGSGSIGGEPSITAQAVPASNAVLDVERRWHCMFAARDSIFAHGGWNEFGPVGSLISFKPSKKLWSVVNTSGDVPAARRWHSLTSLDDAGDRQLLFGGYDGDPDKPFNDAYLFDAATATWKAILPRGQAPGGRSRHSLSVVSGSGSAKTLMLLGGYDEKHDIARPANGLYFLHTDDMRWECINASEVGELFPACRVAHKAVRLGAHGLVIFGGYSGPHVEPLYFIDLRMLGKKLRLNRQQTTAANGDAQ